MMPFRFLVLMLPISGLSAGIVSSAHAQDGPSPMTDIVESWLNSPHADLTSESFRHWNEEGVVAPECATCHSSAGLRDFLGADGSQPGVVDHPSVTGSTVDCAVCHNKTATELDQVAFPSGSIAEGLGPSAICMVCHQGRQSSAGVETALNGLDEDVASPELGFINVHYRAAAASLMGSAAHGAYEYPGKSYSGRFNHVPDFNSCTGCHDPHSLGVETADCAVCHKTDDFLAIRSRPDDADGDGDTGEGAAGEISTLHDVLGQALSNYAATVAGAAVVYASDSYPYFFTDLNSNGQVDGDELGYPNRYQSWTPRMLKAAYNYQFVAKDPGIFAHNPAYAIQILIDSLESLGEVIEVPDGGQWIRP